MCFEKSSGTPRLHASRSRRTKAGTGYHRGSPLDKDHQICLQNKETGTTAREQHRHCRLPNCCCSSLRTIESGSFPPPLLASSLTHHHVHTLTYHHLHILPLYISPCIHGNVDTKSLVGASLSRWDDLIELVFQNARRRSQQLG